MTALPKPRMTVDEFLDWAFAQPEGRYELVRGEVFKMSAERAQHARTKAAAANLLTRAIKAAGASCEAFVDGLLVKIDDATSYEPDALVHCGPRLPDDALIAANPVIVVEVLSPSTGHLDKTVKVADYLTHPAIEHVLVIDAERKVVHHYRRSAPGKADVTIVRDGAISLDPPGLMLKVAEFFEPV